MTEIYIDADACPVKQEVYKVAQRYGLHVYVVANAYMHVPERPGIELVTVPGGHDVADDWIAARAGQDDVVITADIPLADRAIKRGARVLTPRGRALTEGSIGDAVATRDLMQQLREAGAVSGGPKPFAARDRSQLLAKLDETIQAIRRERRLRARVPGRISADPQPSQEGASMSERVYNFSAGPATLPVEVLEEAKESLLSLRGCGIGILEVSHRSPEYSAVHDDAEERVRALAGAGDDWAVLFLQGGASLQFSMVPQNLGADADYVLTDSWSKKALAEAKRLGSPRVAGSSEETGFDRIPDPASLELRDDAAYVHITSNNTIAGTQWREAPETRAPLVCDASSDIFSRPLQLERYGLLYAGAQKNLGPAGVTLVLVRKELLDRCPDAVPTMLRYRTHANSRSLYNTPPCFGIYIVGLVARWIASQGGLEGMAARNEAKAKRLYDAIDESPFYEGIVQPESRSRMNVVFRLTQRDLEAPFIKEAAARGLVGLKGHRSVGGLRASIYNAMPEAGVEALVAFMEEFARANG